MEKGQLIAYMRVVHALFNVTILMLLLFQAWLGLKIRRERKAASPPPLAAVKTHRKLGPILIWAGVLGFVSGWLLIYFHTGHLFKYPVHSFAGLIIALLLLANFSVSKKITEPESGWRTIHFSMGLLILCIFGFQAFLGIGILF